MKRTIWEITLSMGHDTDLRNIIYDFPFEKYDRDKAIMYAIERFEFDFRFQLGEIYKQKGLIYMPYFFIRKAVFTYYDKSLSNFTLKYV